MAGSGARLVLLPGRRASTPSSEVLQEESNFMLRPPLPQCNRHGLRPDHAPEARIEGMHGTIVSSTTMGDLNRLN
jgi:hypothetical protein